MINSVQDLSASEVVRENRIELKWTCAAADGSYNIYRSMVQEGPYILIQQHHKTSECVIILIAY